MDKPKKLTATERLALFLSTRPDVFTSSKKELKIIGQNFLQPHPKMERLCGVYEGYVIVKRTHVEQMIDLFEKHPEYIGQLDE